MLWVGWFGFNAGSALAANTSAGMAMLVTHLATAAAALAWMFLEWSLHKKPSVLGIASGAVAGLVAITPASGTCGPLGSIAIGAAAGVLCFLATSRLKRKLGYDDSLDAFGVHGVGGIVGAILTGVFAAPFLGGAGFADGIASIGAQVGRQCLGVIVTFIYSGIVSFVLLKLLDVTLGLRVSAEEETEGLDLSLHDERGYNG
jgi:Amt family ammonium transporter